MVIGVISDTHGHRQLMHNVAGVLEQELGASVIYHLGDDYDDARELIDFAHEVRAVPGLWCPQYHDGRIPKRLLDTYDGVTVAACHADQDLTAKERAAAVILNGHTHQPKLDKLGRSLYVNPGHLRKGTSRGSPASFATLDIREDTVRAAIHALDGTVRTEMTVPISELG